MLDRLPKLLLRRILLLLPAAVRRTVTLVCRQAYRAGLSIPWDCQALPEALVVRVRAHAGEYCPSKLLWLYGCLLRKQWVIGPTSYLRISTNNEPTRFAPDRPFAFRGTVLYVIDYEHCIVAIDLQYTPLVKFRADVLKCTRAALSEDGVFIVANQGLSRFGVLSADTGQPWHIIDATYRGMIGSTIFMVSDSAVKAYSARLSPRGRPATAHLSARLLHSLPVYHNGITSCSKTQFAWLASDGRVGVWTLGHDQLAWITPPTAIVHKMIMQIMLAPEIPNVIMFVQRQSLLPIFLGRLSDAPETPFRRLPHPQHPLDECAVAFNGPYFVYRAAEVQHENAMYVYSFHVVDLIQQQVMHTIRLHWLELHGRTASISDWVLLPLPPMADGRRLLLIGHPTDWHKVESRYTVYDIRSGQQSHASQCLPPPVWFAQGNAFVTTSQLFVSARNGILMCDFLPKILPTPLF